LVPSCCSKSSSTRNSWALRLISLAVDGTSESAESLARRADDWAENPVVVPSPAAAPAPDLTSSVGTAGDDMVALWTRGLTVRPSPSPPSRRFFVWSITTGVKATASAGASSSSAATSTDPSASPAPAPAPSPTGVRSLAPACDASTGVRATTSSSSFHNDSPSAKLSGSRIRPKTRLKYFSATGRCLSLDSSTFETSFHTAVSGLRGTPDLFPFPLRVWLFRTASAKMPWSSSGGPGLSTSTRGTEGGRDLRAAAASRR